MAVVELVNDMAAPAFQIDKETLVVASEAVRSNWVVALRNTVEMAKKAAGKGVSLRKKYSQVDFGNPAKFTVRGGIGGEDGVTWSDNGDGHHQHAHQHHQHGDENQFFTSMGAAGATLRGTFRMNPAAFSTFQVNDDVDDSDVQSNFRRLRLDGYYPEYEDEEMDEEEGWKSNGGNSNGNGGNSNSWPKQDAHADSHGHHDADGDGDGDAVEVFPSPAAMLAGMDDDGGKQHKVIGSMLRNGRVDAADVIQEEEEDDHQNGVDASRSESKAATSSNSTSVTSSNAPPTSSSTSSRRSKLVEGKAFSFSVPLDSQLFSSSLVESENSFSASATSSMTSSSTSSSPRYQYHVIKSLSLPHTQDAHHAQPAGRPTAAPNMRNNYLASPPKRIRLVRKSPSGPIKVFGGDLRSGELFKTVIVTSEMTTEQVLKIVLGKYDIAPSDAGDYSLVEEESGADSGADSSHNPNPNSNSNANAGADSGVNTRSSGYVRVLDDHESPLIARLNWDNRPMSFVVRKKAAIKHVADTRQFFRVNFVDGARLSLTYNDNLPSIKVCELVAAKMNMERESAGYFALWMEAEGLCT